KEVYDVEIVIDHREKEIDKAGDSVEYLVRVKNKGNSEVTINLELGKSKKDWTAEFKEDRAASFAPGAEKEFHLTVTAPDPVDNKEKCTVTVTAKVLGHDDTAKSVTTKTKVDKGTSTAVMDVLEEYSWILALGLVVIVVAVVVYFRSRQYEEEEEEYEEEEEGYEEEEEEE
ncbi:MAG: hypothetical protein KAU14_01595, partial [Thermoplasmata archaeon]|nr:hypothetical protein [Thermoplasmata archaeon]